MRTDVRAVLDRSKAFHALPEEERRNMANDMVQVLSFVDDPELEAQAREQEELRRLIGRVDFPSFVSDLIEGVFQSIVQASVEQMRAYAELVRSVASSLDEFAEAAGDKDRDHLAGRYPELATIVLLGLDRIVVTSGKIKGKVNFGGKAEESDDDDP